MSFRRSLSWWLLAVAAPVALLIVASSSLSAQGLPRRTPPGQLAELAAGKLLVASRDLLDPNFAATVVLLVDYSPDGAAGVVVNRRTEDPLSVVFKELAFGPNGSQVVFRGGPVSRASALGLLRSRGPVAGARQVAADVHLLASREPLERALSSPVDANRLRIYLGHSGWGAGQLEREIARGAWHLFDADVNVVFDADPATVWRRLIRRTELRQAKAGPTGRLCPCRVPSSAL
jgi:putative transcriptional regulator